LEVVKYLPASLPTHELALDLWNGLRNALLPLGEYERTLDCLREAEALPQRLDDPARIAEVMCSTCMACWLMGRTDHAISAAERVLVYAVNSGEMGLFTEGMESLEEGHRIAEIVNRPWDFPDEYPRPYPC
jgi:hypothetical protein